MLPRWIMGRRDAHPIAQVSLDRLRLSCAKSRSWSAPPHQGYIEDRTTLSIMGRQKLPIGRNRAGEEHHYC